MACEAAWPLALVPKTRSDPDCAIRCLDGGVSPGAGEAVRLGELRERVGFVAGQAASGAKPDRPIGSARDGLNGLVSQAIGFAEVDEVRG